MRRKNIHLTLIMFLALFLPGIAAAASEKPEIFPQLGHTEKVNSIAFSPDGRFILSGSDDSTLRLWDAATGKEIRQFAGHTEQVTSIAFSPDGRFVLSTGFDKTLRLWDAAAGKEIRQFSGHRMFICAVAFSPDGQFALSGSYDGTMRLWNVNTGESLREFTGQKDSFCNFAFSPNGRFVISGVNDRGLRLWDVNTGKEIRQFANKGSIHSIAFSPDGRFVLSSGVNTMQLWNVTTGKKIRSFIVNKFHIEIAFSPDGKFVLSGSDDGDLRLWNAATGKEVRQFAGHTEQVTSVAFSPDGRFVLSTSRDKTVRLWEATTGKKIRLFGGHTSLVRFVAFSPDGQSALSGSLDGTLRKWDVNTGGEIRSFAGHPEGITDVAFSPDGKLALSGSSHSKILRLCDVSAGKSIRQFVGHTEGVTRVAFSPDGRFALSGSSDKTIRLWDVVTGKEKRQFIGHTFWISSIAFSPDGRLALSGSVDENPDNYLRLWNVSTGKGIRSFVGHTSWVNSLAFSPDGRLALSGSDDKTLRLWDVTTGKEIRRFAGHTKWVTAVAFSPDGRFALSGSSDKTMRLWDVATGKEIRQFAGHTSTIFSVAFSPDLRFALSGSFDASTRAWDLNNGSELVQFIGFTDGEWIAITPEGYYNSSLNGHQYLNIRVSDKVYGIEQFYDVFYRPDIVAAKLRGDDISGLITLTIDEAIKNPPPTVEFSSVPKKTDQPRVKVCYQARSTGGGIGEVRLFHNGKLIQSDGYYREVAKTSAGTTQLASLNSRSIYADMRDLHFKAKTDAAFITSQAKGDLFEDCKEIDAIAGENEVSVSAFNGSNTVQSYMKTIKFNSGIKAEEPRLYILAIGINRYKDSSINLKYAVKDAKELEAKIKTRSATLYQHKNIHYFLLTDAEANKTNIINKINQLANTVKPLDSFIIFVAGHGVLLQNQYYMLTHDFHGQVSDTGMISSNEIVEMSKKIKSLNQLFIFDTCHAGGVDTIISGLYDARMSVLAKKMGLHIYASANDKQAAMDGYKGNGLFTHTLLNGFNNNKEADKYKDGKVSIVGLGEYSRKMTMTISREIGHSQTPLIINFGKDSLIYKLQ